MYQRSIFLAFKDMPIFLSIMDRSKDKTKTLHVCKCGFVFGKHFKTTTQHHLNGLRHTMLMNGASHEQYTKFIFSKSVLQQKCTKRLTNRIGDNNWTCLTRKFEILSNYG